MYTNNYKAIDLERMLNRNYSIYTYIHEYCFYKIKSYKY